ncbi:MAG: 3 beta-hydroxysteroid dehydrogenase/Delta 5--_4-isomerase [Alphaproteobacteria bacterium MarineAlpha3_Bin4]|nr:hopanoid-associated sugar epimerase [Pseudomonadota bacterium]PPR76670.1 MAG: 3 beta-hydroxysteroid dehydrogenase/Delta 5-->4-isomerase [Alphaproteobacteria bacterium MarineAlpha3_Bin4]
MMLVTGASGFVGSAVLRRLIEAGERVRALVRPTSERRNLDGIDVEIVEGDLSLPKTLRAGLDGCKGLYHVAADYRLWTREPRKMLDTNVDGTRAIMLAAAEAGVERIVYTSSVATLGMVSSGVADEETPVGFEDMIGVYKQSKYLAEQEVLSLFCGDGLPVVIVNPSTPIGPRDIKPTPTGRMVVEAASGRMPAYVDTGLNVVHVDDVADGHLLAYGKGVLGERYVLGGENMELSEILRVVAAQTGGKAPKVKIPHGVVMPLAYGAEAWTWLTGGKEPFVTVDAVRMARKKMFFASDKAIRDLGYAPRPAETAIRDAVAWFANNGYLG